MKKLTLIQSIVIIISLTILIIACGEDDNSMLVNNQNQVTEREKVKNNNTANDSNNTTTNNSTVNNQNNSSNNSNNSNTNSQNGSNNIDNTNNNTGNSQNQNPNNTGNSNNNGNQGFCIPNLDGMIESHEMAPTLNQIASYIFSEPVPITSEEGWPVDVVGQIENGARVWDWSDEFSNDSVSEYIARPLTNQWYAEHFPNGHFSMTNDPFGLMVGIYSHDEDALKLHGFASIEEDGTEGKTLLVYEEAINFFPFPIVEGSEWNQTGKVRNGYLKGLHPWSQDDVYQVKAQSHGMLILPDFTFEQAIRLSIKVEIKPKAGSREGFVQYQTSFVNECFGEVARASSMFVMDPENDPGPDFSTAYEIKRLGW